MVIHSGFPATPFAVSTHNRFTEISSSYEGSINSKSEYSEDPFENTMQEDWGSESAEH